VNLIRRETIQSAGESDAALCLDDAIVRPPDQHSEQRAEGTARQQGRIAADDVIGHPLGSHRVVLVEFSHPVD